MKTRTGSEVRDKYGKRKEKWSETQESYDDHCSGEDEAKE